MVFIQYQNVVCCVASVEIQVESGVLLRYC